MQKPHHHPPCSIGFEPPSLSASSHSAQFAAVEQLHGPGTDKRTERQRGILYSYHGIHPLYLFCDLLQVSSDVVFYSSFATVSAMLIAPNCSAVGLFNVELNVGYTRLIYTEYRHNKSLNAQHILCSLLVRYMRRRRGWSWSG